MTEDWKKDLKPLYDIERSLQKRYRRKTFAKFVKAIKTYDMLREGDKVAVAISGGKDSLILAKLFQLLHRYSDFPFDVEYIAMDPGYSKENRERLEFHCDYLKIPVKIYDSNVFEVSQSIAVEKPCYMCARMRRGFLYDRAQELGCNKLALGHHFNDVIETTLLNLFWAATYKNMMPKLKSRNFENMELIRPLYFVEEKSIKQWADYAGLRPLDCACKVAEKKEGSQRAVVKRLLEEWKEWNPNIDISIFRSGENVHLDAVLGYSLDGEKHSFLEHYEEDEWKL